MSGLEKFRAAFGLKYSKAKRTVKQNIRSVNVNRKGKE